MAELPSGLLNIASALPVRLRQAGVVESSEPFTHESDKRDNEHKLLFVREGQLQVTVEGDRFDLTSDQALVVLPGEENCTAHPAAGKLQLYFVYFFLKKPRSTSDIISLNRICHINRPDRLTSFFRLILDDQLSNNLDNLSTRMLLMQILAETAEEVPPEVISLSTANSLMDRGKAHIRRYYMESLSTAGIARELDVSPSYFGRAFCKAAGYSVSEFILVTRMYQARKLLTGSNLSIKQIAHDCGFEDAAYFSRAFKKREGMSPRAYKRLHSRYYAH